MMGDLTKSQYVIRRNRLRKNSSAPSHRPTPDLDRAQALIEDFARLWEPSPTPPSGASSWQKDGAIVAVKPTAT